MIKSETNLRVIYGDTDKMGVVYYGIYPRYFEVGRTEMMREIGLCYSELEKRGIIMPVVQMNIEYFASAKYDDVLTIRTTVDEMPTARIRFNYEIFTEAETLLTRGFTDLSFIKADTLRACRPPVEFLESIKKYF